MKSTFFSASARTFGYPECLPTRTLKLGQFSFELPISENGDFSKPFRFGSPF